MHDHRSTTLRIAYVVTRSDPIGGAQVHVRDLSRAMHRAGHEAWVLTGGEGHFTEWLTAQGTPFTILRYLTAPIDPWRDLRALAEVRGALRAVRPDLVSAHSSKAGVLGRVAARSLGIPTVFTAHGWSFTPGVPAASAALYRWSERLAAPLASRIITVSNFDRELAIRERVASADRLVTIHNGMPDVPSALRAEPGATPVRLTMIARFEPQKDHATLFRALADVRDLDWRIDLIGDGPLLPEARRLALELGLAERVRFCGPVDNVPTLLAEAQVYLLISNWEGFPRSILEAMRAGVPVVASRVGGVDEAVEDGVSGFLAPRGDSTAVARALRTLLQDPALRRRQGARGRVLYEARFDLALTIARTVEVYNAVVGGRGSVTPARHAGVPAQVAVSDRAVS
ncbi:MAG: glycosyltransferase family 4 protein [Gemmatimonadales bacterium]|nr:glycosyltransferase family 4 protein [Gemmatimonadales bacterium]